MDLGHAEPDLRAGVGHEDDLHHLLPEQARLSRAGLGEPSPFESRRCVLRSPESREPEHENRPIGRHQEHLRGCPDIEVGVGTFLTSGIAGRLTGRAAEDPSGARATDPPATAPAAPRMTSWAAPRGVAFVAASATSPAGISGATFRSIFSVFMSTHRTQPPSPERSPAAAIQPSAVTIPAMVNWTEMLNGRPDRT